MKDAILTAAIEVITLHGLTNWTVEEVANRAHCAKGLVNYHYRSKQALLQRAAETVRDDRAARRFAAIQSQGTRALDRLWDALYEEVKSGWFGARLSLLAADDPLRRAVADREADTAAFAAALSESLGLGDQLAGQGPLIQAILDGIQLRLLQDASREETEEAYNRVWLLLLSENSVNSQP